MSQLCNELDIYDAIVKKTLDRNIPFKVDWEITYRCNLKCAHCYQTGPSKEEELGTDKICSILDELAAMNCLYITFSGGEIFLRKDFFDIANYAKSQGFALRLFTNGTLIDEKIADQIKDLNPLTVEISLYGVNPAIHEKITQVKGSHQRTVNALKLLCERNINTVVKSTVMKDNVQEFDRLKEFSKNLGMGFVFTFTVIPKIDGSKEVIKLRLKYDELKEVFLSRDWLTEGIEKGGVHSYKPLCAAGFNSLYISPYGDIFPCVVLREHCGNLKEKSLREIWQAEVFKKLRGINFEDLKECYRCSLSEFCDRCAGVAWLEEGNFLGCSPNDYTLAKVRKAMLEIRRKANEEKEVILKA